MVARAFNPSTWKAEPGGAPISRASLVYRVSSRTARTKNLILGSLKAFCFSLFQNFGFFSKINSKHPERSIICRDSMATVVLLSEEVRINMQHNFRFCRQAFYPTFSQVYIALSRGGQISNSRKLITVTQWLRGKHP